MAERIYKGMMNVWNWKPGEEDRRGGKPMYENARFMMFSYETTRDAIARALPEPLEPGPEPIVSILFADYPVWWSKDGTNQPYNEVIVQVQCQYKGEVGITIPHIYIGTRTGDFTDGCDAALIAGRENMGFPKKLANIDINPDGDAWTGTMYRRRTSLVDFRGRFDQPVDPPSLPLQSIGRLMLVKEVVSADWQGYDVRAVHATPASWLKGPKSVRTGTAAVRLGRIPGDPLADLKIVKPLLALEMVTDISGDDGAVERLADLNAR